MKKKGLFLLTFLLSIMLVLTACNSEEKKGTSSGESGKGKETEKIDTSKFPMSVKNEGTPIKGGTLNVALVASSPFKGILTAELYEDAYDAEIMAYASNSLFEMDGDFIVTDKGIAKLEVDKDNNKAKITIRDGVKWSDGEPLKVEDLMFPYELIGHPDYTGVRYDEDLQNIIGIEDYHDGKADTISGLKKLDEKTLEISFKKVSPAIYSVGDGLWGSAAPKHQLASIPVADLLASDAVRKNPVTLGAFKYDNIVNGESVQLVANEHYWRGKPKIDKVIIQTVNPSAVAEGLKSGKYDLATSYPASQYDGVKDLKNIKILGRPELAYSYISFKLGKYDKAQTMSVMDDKAKMNDEKLRQAIVYAMNVELVSDKYYQGLRTRANSLIPPVFKTYYDKSLAGYKYDPEKAKKLLDEAGYKDTNGDGIREDKSGNKFTINLASMSGTDTDEAIVQLYRQNWKEVGLDVQLATGRLIEFNSFYEKVQADDPEIDMFMAAWGTGTNPSPMGLYSSKAEYNFSRFVSEDLTKMLQDIDSKESMNPEHRAKAFRKWQEYMSEKAVAVPTYFRTEIVPVNNRVKNYNIDYSNPTQLQDLELVAESPVKQ